MPNGPPNVGIVPLPLGDRKSAMLDAAGLDRIPLAFNRFQSLFSVLSEVATGWAPSVDTPLPVRFEQ
ncbi:hypothetical protein [Nocardia sp. NPDC057030]|uniref:hypothetical protein n=1 Tax=unclassified Nocardia TaxID=2637762 RepID=UPI003632349E